jgi:hypothetical protein
MQNRPQIGWRTLALSCLKNIIFQNNLEKILYFSKIEKCLTFEKWTKINVQILKIKILLLRKKFV